MKYLKQYQKFHRNGKRFRGRLKETTVLNILGLLTVHHPVKDMLDYGSGKGHQYLVDRVHEQWGVDIPYCYDPAVMGLDVRPYQSRFDGVICTDVLEHVPEDELNDVIADIVGYANKFVYVNVATKPSKKEFSNGDNIHVTIKPPEWWEDRFRKFKAIPTGPEIILNYDDKT